MLLISTFLLSACGNKNVLIVPKGHSYISNGYIVEAADGAAVYNIVESGELKKVEVANKSISTMLLDRLVEIELVCLKDDMSIINQSLKYDLYDNDEEVYGSDIVMSLCRLGLDNEYVLLYACLSQADTVLQCKLLSVVNEEEYLLVDDDIYSYMDEIKDVKVSVDKKYAYFSGLKQNKNVLVCKNFNEGIIKDLTDVVCADSDDIGLNIAGDIICVAVDGRQVWRLTDEQPLKLYEVDENEFFMFTSGKYMTVGVDNKINGLISAENGEYISLPETFNRDEAFAIGRRASDKIMFINEKDADALELKVFDAVTGKIVNMSCKDNIFKDINVIEWLDNERIILQGTYDDKIAYEILGQ